MTADRGDRWDDVDDWGSDDWERWEMESRHPDFRLDPTEFFDDGLDDEGFEGELSFEA